MLEDDKLLTYITIHSQMEVDDDDVICSQDKTTEDHFHVINSEVADSNSYQ